MDVSRPGLGNDFGTLGSLFSARQYRDIQRALSHPTLAQGAAQQRERDAARLANPKITLRDKKRIRAAAPLSPV